MEPEPDYKRALKRFVKKHKREIQAAHDNLDTFFKALLAGATPQQVKLGAFILNHPASWLSTKKAAARG